MPEEVRAVFADIGTVHIWSGGGDVMWNGETYNPGILLADDIPSGQSLQPAASPGVNVFIQNVPTLRSDVSSGDEFEIHVCKLSGSTWEKICLLYTSPSPRD